MADASERRVLAAVRAHARQGLLPAAAWRVGLESIEFTVLCDAVGVDPVGADGPWAGDEPPPRLLPALIDLLWSSRTADGPWTRLMAGTIASAAFGARHLWQDLGADGRPEVSALMHGHFRSLAERNVRNLKWKHHLFLCLGERLGQPELRPPRCDGCDEHAVCFPAEQGVVTLRRADERTDAGTPGAGQLRSGDRP